MAKNAKQNEMTRMLMGLFGGPVSIPAQVMKGAHDNIDALISNNENKDFFELQNASMMGNVGMMGGMKNPKWGNSMGNIMPSYISPGGIGNIMPSAIGGMGNMMPNTGLSISDEVPQGTGGTYPNEQAFQQAIQRLQLEQTRQDPRIQSILGSHIGNLFKQNK